MGAENVGNQSESRQRHDIHFGVTEEPEQVLEQNRAAAVVVQLIACSHDGWHEETGSQCQVEGHHDGADEQCREGKQTKDGGHQNSPDRQRKTHHRQSSGACLKHRGHIIQTAHGEGDDEHAQGDQHQQNACVMPRGAWCNRLRRIQSPACPGGPSGDEEAGQKNQHRQQVDPETEHVQEGEDHVPRTAHQGNQIVAKAAEEQGGEKIHHHDHSVHRHGLIVGTGVDEREGIGEAQLQAHESGEYQRHQAHKDGSATVLDRNHLVILTPDVFRNERVRIMQFMVLVGYRDISHCHPPDSLAAAGMWQWIAHMDVNFCLSFYNGRSVTAGNSDTQ